MSKRLGLLIVMMLFVSLMTGCFGSDDDSTSTTPATAASVVITGSIPALSAPAGAPNYMVAYGTNYEMGVFNAATMTEVTGSAVVISGTTYTATVPAGAAVTALVVIRHKATGKIVYSALAGILPTSTAMSAGSVAKVTVSGVNLTGESTAIATLAKDKGIVAPSVPVSSTVTTMSASVKTAIDSAVGTATLTAITNAVSAVQAVLNNAGVSEATKTSILAAVDSALAGVLNAFIAAVKDASAVVNTTIGATTVSVGGQTIGATSTTTDVTSAVNGVTVVTITAVSNPADITVASGTAVTAITFPTTVSVTKSNGTTATASVVWSTTSVPAYVATTSGTYVFTGTVSGTTLTAKVNVIVGAAAQTVATPTFTPAAGTYTAAQSVTIACATTGASIYYTTDGTTPTTASTAYTTAINVAATTTIKAIAVKTGMTNSAVASALYTMNISLIPVISAERAVKQANGDVVVTWTTDIVTPTAAKVIVRGSVPTPSDPSVTETATTTTSHTVTVTADKLAGAYDKLVISYIIGEDGTSKEILKAAIVDAASVVADPVITPAAGTYTSAQSVTITCATAGASIYYTVDGTTPTSASTLYSAAFNVSASATVKAIATKATMTNSNVVSAAYVINISTTKVLTGIALAKATDTVEANVAYTLPAVTASYDDTTSATVTASWAKGATAVTGTSVTETAAGTFTYTATYVENGVTKTADFTLVVTAAVPVKTLDSLTVTATPAAPTCYVGGTTSVALAVVAKYLTGTATSEAAVTTFTTGSNWANSIFTAASTAAGTENIVVTYTEGGVTKTANVAVTVNVAAAIPTISTVTVVNATTLQVVFATAPTTELVTADASKFTVLANSAAVTVSAVAKVVSDLTGKTYRLTVATLANQEGSLTINGIAPATKIVTGSEYDFDFKAPSIVSVAVVGIRQIKVTFSEKMDTTAAPATAADVALAYTFKKVSDGVNHITNVAGVIAVLSADKKSVTITLNADMVPAAYTFAVPGNVYDIQAAAGTYKVYVGTEVSVTPTAAQLVDTTPAKIVAATYNNVTAKLSITLDKSVTDSLNDVTKFAITDGTTTVTLTASDIFNTDTTADNNTFYYTLGTTSKTAVNAMTGTITLNVAANGFGKTGAMTTGDTFTVTREIPAVLSTASYSQVTKILTLTFDMPVTLEAATIATLQTATTSGTVVVLKSEAVETPTTTARATWTFNLGTTKDAALAALVPTPTSTNLKAYVAAAAVKNVALVANLDTQNAYATGVTTTYTSDTTKPVLTAASYNNNTKRLTLTFDKKVSKTLADITKAGISIMTDASTTVKTLTLVAAQADIVETANATTLTFILDNAHGGTNLTAEATAIELSYNKRESMKVVLAANVVKDEAAPTPNQNIATTYATGSVALTFNDYVAPTITALATVNANLLRVTFSETVDTTTAQTVANYTIKDNTLAALNVTSAAVQARQADGKMDVLLITDTQVSGKPYNVTIKNIKDSSNNVMADYTTGTFNGSAVVDVTNLTLDTLAAAAPINSKNDTLTLTFNAAPNPTLATNVANYTVLEAATNDTAGWNAATAVSLTNAKAEMVSGAETQVKITLDAANLQNDKWYKVVAANITTVTGKTLGANSGDNDAIIQLTGVAAPAAPTIVESNLTANGIEITFAEELNAADANKATSYTIVGKTISTAVYSWDAVTLKSTVKITLTAALTTPVAVTLVGGDGATTLKNLAGKSFATALIAAPATLTDKVAPTIDTIVAKTVSGKENDLITVTFKDNDILSTSATISANYVIKDPAGVVIPDTKYTIAFVDGGASADAVTFTFDKNATADVVYNLQYNQSYKVSVSGILDVNGNTMTAVTDSVATWDAASDSAAPTFNGAALTIATTTNTLTVTSNEILDKVSAETVANYKAVYDVDGDFATTADQTTLTPILSTYVAGALTVALVVSNDTSKFVANSKVRVTLTGVKDLAGNATTGTQGTTDISTSGVMAAATAWAPGTATNFSFDASTGKFTVLAAEGNGVYRVYFAGVLKGSLTKTAASNTTSTGTIDVTGLVGQTITYTYTAGAAPESSTLTDGNIPAAPTAAAIKVGANNPANYINNATKAAAVVSVTPVAGQVANDKLYAVVTTTTPASVSNVGGAGVVNPTTATATDVTLADASALADTALVVTAYVLNSDSGNKSATFTGTAGTKDVVLPTITAAVGTAASTAITSMTFSEAVYAGTAAAPAGALTAAKINYSAAGNFLDTAALSAIVHTAGATTATATTPTNLTKLTSTIGPAATAIFDAAGNPAATGADGANETVIN